MGARLFYALDSASIFSMSAIENLMPRPRWWAWILPAFLQRRIVIEVMCHLSASWAVVQNICALVSL